MTDPGITDPLVLQDLVEKLVLLRMVVEQGRRQLSPITSPLLAGRLRCNKPFFLALLAGNVVDFQTALFCLCCVVHMPV